jgi:hypothetical protein
MIPKRSIRYTTVAAGAAFLSVDSGKGTSHEVEKYMERVDRRVKYLYLMIITFSCAYSSFTQEYVPMINFM